MTIQETISRLDEMDKKIATHDCRCAVMWCTAEKWATEFHDAWPEISAHIKALEAKVERYEKTLKAILPESKSCGCG